MDNTNQTKMKVNIIEVSKEANEILINDGQGNENWVPVVFPAQVKYCKVGEADITLTNGSVTYCRNTTQSNQASGYNNQNGGYSKPYKPFKPYTQTNPIQANSYEPEEKESKRIGMTTELVDVSLEEIRLTYNTLSLSGKWIVASNIFARSDKPGKYDCMFFISEKREGFDRTPYFQVQTKSIDEMEVTPQVTKEVKKLDTPLKAPSTIKVQDMGTY